MVPDVISAEAHTGFLPPHARSPRAFTLIELLLAIAVIGILARVLFPAAQGAVREAQRTRLKANLNLLRREAISYREEDEHHNYPSPEEFGEWLAEVDSAIAEWDGSQLNDKHKDYYYTIWTDEQGVFHICAQPKFPYSDGSFVFCIDEDGVISEREPDEEAVAEEEAREEDAIARALEGVGKVISLANDAGDASLVKPFLQLPEVIDTALEAPDQNEDGVITKEEMEDFVKPQEDDTAVMAEARATVHDCYYILQLDRREYEGVAIEDVQGDPTALFSPGNFRLFIRRCVRPELVESLQSKVVALDRWERLPEDDPDRRPACTGIVGAFRNEVWAQAGKAVSFDNAILLDALVGVYCPPKELPD